MARRSALDHEHRRDVAERLALEYLPAGDPAGIKAQIAGRRRKSTSCGRPSPDSGEDWKSSKTAEGNETRPDRHTHKTEKPKY